MTRIYSLRFSINESEETDKDWNIDASLCRKGALWQQTDHKFKEQKYLICWLFYFRTSWTGQTCSDRTGPPGPPGPPGSGGLGRGFPLCRCSTLVLVPGDRPPPAAAALVHQHPAASLITVILTSANWPLIVSVNMQQEPNAASFACEDGGDAETSCHRNWNSRESCANLTVSPCVCVIKSLLIYMLVVAMAIQLNIFLQYLQTVSTASGGSERRTAEGPVSRSAVRVQTGSDWTVEPESSAKTRLESQWRRRSIATESWFSCSELIKCFSTSK